MTQQKKMRTFCLGKQNQVHACAFLPAAGNPLQLIAAKKAVRWFYTSRCLVFIPGFYPEFLCPVCTAELAFARAIFTSSLNQPCD